MLGVSGCSPSQTVPAEPDSVRAAASIESASRRLEALAELEAYQAPADPRVIGRVLRTAAGTVDPGFPDLIRPGTEAFGRASRALDDLLAEFPLPQPAGDVPEPGQADARQAARDYAAGRSVRLEGDPDRAIGMLERAARLDPGAPALWSELGRAYAETGDRIGAADAFQTAVELGERDAQALLLLADLAASQRDARGVIRWSAPVFQARDGAPRARRTIAGAMLGSALLDLGHLRAGAGVLTETLSMLRGSRDPGEPLELSRLRSRATEFAVLAGDAWAALGQPAEALAVYESATNQTGMARPVVLQRTLAASLNADRPATAALLLLDHLDASSGDLGPEEPRWIGGLGRVNRIRETLFERLEELATDPGRPPSARRQVIRSVVRGWPDLQAVVSLLERLGADARSSVIAGDLLLRLDGPDRVSVARKLIESDPMTARAFGSALSRLVDRPGEQAASLIASEDPHAMALGMGICLETTDARPALAVIDAEFERFPDASLVAEICGVLGRWDQADRWIAAARDQFALHPDRRAQYLGSLLTCARLAEARELSLGIDADARASTDELLAAAEAAFLIGDDAAVRARVERAASIDPFDERVLERRLGFASDTAEEDDGAAMRAFGRELAEVRTRGALFALLRAREIGGQGRMREAIDLIASVGEREPSRDLGVLLLAQGSRTAGASGDQATQRLAIAWLEQRAGALPGSTPTAIAYAQALAGVDPAASLTVLDDAYARIGHPEIARAAEAMLTSEPLLRDNESLIGPGRRVLERTTRRADPDSCIERAGALIRFGDPLGALQAASDALPEGGSLTRDQLDRWSAAVGQISRAVDGDATLGESPSPGAIASIIDRVDARADRIEMQLPAALQQARLVSLVRAGDTERLDSIVAERTLGEDTGLLVVQALLGGERVSEGIDMLGGIAVATGDPDESLLDEWARLVGAGGSAANVRALLARLDDDGAARVAGVLRSRFGLGDLPGEGGAPRDRADIAYSGGLIASVFGRDAEAEGMHRLALEFDPDHAWACNDLGYGLAERGVSLDEAERLTVRALALLGERASVLDSLAWVRYKQGVIGDVFAEDGTVAVRGAVTLLRRAAALDDGRGNATIQTHLGDALWRAGDREGAVRSWMTAETLLRERASEIAASDNAGGRASVQTADRLNRVIRRMTDVKNDQTPRIDPLGRGVRDPLRGD